ncbi:MAG: 1-acyl-sn-glycerol-3-phosphate acyltransferase [Pirellulaceae bacterium]|nr:1-acyl-sn-glycerol-3-phosphate acyltransferase [Pirellulaceae bacterium]
MQNILIEKPYQFIPPHRGRWIPSLIQKLDLYSRYLRKEEGVVDYEVRNVERLKTSLANNNGIMLCPNHSRQADPLVMGYVAREAQTLIYTMASWHVFHQGWLSAWAARKMGAFSLYREGIDRQSLTTAIDILATAERPLVIFPEGAVSRTNDILQSLLDGVGFIARSAAKKCSKENNHRTISVHPIAIKYYYQGNLKQSLSPVLSTIEHRLTWPDRTGESLLERIAKVGNGLLSLKELQYFDEAHVGPFEERLLLLTEKILKPLEEKWLTKNNTPNSPVVPRVKGIRMKIMPKLIEGEISSDERKQIWYDLSELYLAQQLTCYPPNYLNDNLSVERILETVERFEEDLTDKATVHGDLKVVLDVGEPIEISPEEEIPKPAELTATLALRLQTMLDHLAQEATPWNET